MRACRRRPRSAKSAGTQRRSPKAPLAPPTKATAQPDDELPLPPPGASLPDALLPEELDPLDPPVPAPPLLLPPAAASGPTLRPIAARAGAARLPGTACAAGTTRCTAPVPIPAHDFDVRAGRGAGRQSACVDGRHRRGVELVRTDVDARPGGPLSRSEASGDAAYALDIRVVDTVLRPRRAPVASEHGAACEHVPPEPVGET